MEENNVVVVSAVRTPFGKFGGTLKDIPSIDLGAMVIREHNQAPMPTVPNRPLSLVSQVLTRNSIRLIWQDASSDETGFEVWQSLNNVNYQRIAQLPAGTTTFTNTGLAGSTQYFYKVRAVNLVGPSEYSNETNATTFDFSVSVNYAAVFGNAAGWNNYPAFMNTGFVANNLVDDTGQNTGISMRIVKEFTGENNFGVNTGNNSGIFPDIVMRGAYYLDPRADAVIRFENLSFLKKYNFTFFGSRGDGASLFNRNTNYIINGVTVTLNASSNSNNIVQIKDVVPDANGTITVTVATTAGSLYGYLNALVIQAVPGSGGGGGPASREAGAPIENLSSSEGGRNNLGIDVYPNPFTDRVGMILGAEMPEGFSVQVINTTGVTVYSGEFTRMPAGQELELLFGQDLPGGVYILRVVTKGGTGTNFRLVKK